MKKDKKRVKEALLENMCAIRIGMLLLSERILAKLLGIAGAQLKQCELITSCRDIE